MPLPHLPSPPPDFCQPRCPVFPPGRPVPPSSPHHALLAHAIHRIVCVVGPFRHRRHDAIVRLIAAAFRDLLQIHATTSTRLCSSSRNGRKVDCVITDYTRHPPVTAIDATISCPLCPSLSAAAALDATTLFATRARHKIEKHLPGCAELGRSFTPIVMTTLLGIGPAPAREFLDSIFSPALAEELLAFGSGRSASLRRLIFVQSLQVALVRGIADQLASISAAEHEPTVTPDSGASPAP